jgi:hypothetical protein
MEKKTAILVVILVVLLVLTGLFFVIFRQGSVTGDVVSSEYSYTKAICNESNYCEDYEVVCYAENVKTLTPTGYVAQFSEDWVDERDNKNLDGLC